MAATARLLVGSAAIAVGTSLVLALASVAHVPGIAGVARAQGAAVAQAGAYELSARGPDAGLHNPAALAWNSAWKVRLSAAGSVQNNTFSLSDYNRWNGEAWTASDEAEILDRIDGTELTGRYHGGLQSPGLSWRSWAVNIETRSLGSVQLPAEYVRLLFDGNVPGSTWQFQGTGGRQFSYTALGVSHGRELGSVNGWKIAGGATLRYLRGWQYNELVEIAGDLTTDLDVLTGDIVATSRTAAGGHGLALDLGWIARGPNGIDLGLSLRNVYGFVDWSDEARFHVDRAVADSVVANDLEDDDFLDLSSDVPVDASFRDTLPIELALAVGGSIEQASIELDYRQGFDDAPGVSTTPRVAVGASHPLVRWAVARAGVAVGGEDGPVLAIGGGVHFGGFEIDLAYQGLGSFHVFLPKGIGGAMSVSYTP